MENKYQNEKGLGLGVLIIAILVLLMIAPLRFGFDLSSFREGPSAFLTGVYLQLWGISFLLSYYFSHKTFFFRGLIWVCENLSFPRTRKMAIFYFLLAFSLGTVALLQGIGLFSSPEIQKRPSLPPGAKSIEHWWYKDPLLYVVIALNIAYAYRRHKSNKRK